MLPLRSVASPSEPGPVGWPWGAGWGGGRLGEVGDSGWRKRELTEFIVGIRVLKFKVYIYDIERVRGESRMEVIFWLDGLFLLKTKHDKTISSSNKALRVQGCFSWLQRVGIEACCQCHHEDTP